MVVKRPLGFGDLRQTSEFFGLPRQEVTRRAKSGEWPSYVIAGRRVFDLDQLVELLVRGRAEDPVAGTDQAQGRQ